MNADLLQIAKAAALLPKGWELATQFASNFNNKAQYDFRLAHVAYCTNVVKKYCRARTFFVREDPQFLDEFYVPASIIKGARRRIERANLSSLASIGRKVIVTGSGGSGKTVFMRYLLLDAIERGVGYPVFIELRNLNDVGKVNLEDVIVRFMKEHGFPLSDELALRSLKEGLLVVILDGFDEVVFSKRKELEGAIKRLGSLYASQVVISSRPDIVLEGWDGFGDARIAPLELDEACELIEKIKLRDDGEIKSRFVARLKGGLFKSHQYFLSNPLLLSIMLLTYGDSADIPKKFASFYEQAYTALFQKHDALKSGYLRERHTALDIYEFSRLFSAFSAITYEKRAFRFSNLNALKYVEQAKRIAGMPNVDAGGFIEDARQAVCLLVDDGLDLAFVHRSFQEYFVARFINDAEESLQKKYIKKIASSNQDRLFEVDNVLKLLHEMAPALVEDNYLIPGLEKIFGAGGDRKLSLAGWRQIFRKMFSSVHMHERDQLAFSVKTWSELAVVLFMAKNCLERFGERRSRVGTDLARHFTDAQEIKTKDIADRSPIWREMANIPGSFSLEYFEAIRVESRLMQKRACDRAAALNDIFSFV